MKTSSLRFWLLLCCISFVFISATHADIPIVSADTNGNVSFTPSVMVESILEVVVACVVSAAAFLVIWHFVYALMRALSDRGFDRAAEQRARWDAEPHFESWADEVGWGTKPDGSFNNDNEKLGPGF